jgi:branched-chain amino acid transport system substrate-binding protein
MQKILVTGIFVIALGAIYFMAADQGGAPGSAAGGEGITLGGAFGLSGPCAEWGEGEKNGAQMAVDEINAAGGVNGKQLAMVVEDTQCDNKTTVSAVNKLIHVDKVRVIIGPTWGDAFQGAAAVVRAAQVPAVSPDAALEAFELRGEPVDYFFSTFPPARAEIARLQEYAVSKGVIRAAIAGDQDSYSEMMVSLFKEGAAARGITITREEQAPTGNQDFRTVLAKMREDKPDAIFISFLTASAKGSFLKQAKELGVNALVLSAADIQDASALESFGAAMEGVIYTYPKAAAGQAAFASAYRAKYGRDPEGPAAVNAYDAVRIVAEALRQAGEGAAGAAIQERLLSVAIPGTFTSELRFGEKHQVSGGEFEVKTVKSGQFAPMAP